MTALQALLWVLHELQQNAAAEIWFRYDHIVNQARFFI